jgi:hypothetical protein
MKEREVMDVFGVSSQVREEACEAGLKQVGKTDPFTRSVITGCLEAAAPVIAGAAYKAGLLKAREVVEAERLTLDRPDLLTKEGLAQDEAYNRAIRDALAAIEKEGETSE